ncbi:metallopeptidase M20 [Aspergillus brasiliensis]|uniref:Metallopeptidase M20 n=1 Tax=Aspergillus brasiliensis TaxID=319629 RepID=A0A9W5Z212_9EURO|nr:metallopeptidase M20 [Aspergillus brasiliensis]GKZ51613.1 metallopeptidase M20 [Aspergillus brasiliensis]
MASDALDQVFTNPNQGGSGLAKAVEIQSVSSDLTTEGRGKVDQMTEFLESQLRGLGADVQPWSLGNQPDTDPVLKLPDVVVANYPATPDPKKRTVLIYGHYDVQPEGDGWTHPAWELTEVDGKLYGRGSTDDKGPVLAWLNALEAYQQAGVDVPVNLLFCFEGMEESGSIGFSESAQEHKDIFTNVDAACISDNYWLTTRKPCLTYGLRGINYFTITIAQKPLPGHEPPVPLHSGIYGGTVHEPMTELVIMLSKLADSNGNILIPGINGLVDDVTPDEIAQYENIDFDMDEFSNTIRSEAAIYATAKDTLMHRWRYPSLTIHGINGADPSPNQTTAIYPKVTGKFSIRTVPTMDGKAVTALVVHYLEQEFEKLGSKNTCEVKEFGESAPYWVGNTEDSNFAAGAAATNRVYNTKPDLTREGGSIGVTLDIQNALGPDKSIMLLPVGRSDDGAHGPDEKLDRDNYIEGSKLLGAYWWYFANA